MTSESVGPPIRIGGWFQGPTGSGQGGWTAHRFLDRIAERTDEPMTAAIKAPIPLDTDLHVVGAEAGWGLVDPDGTTIMLATAWTPSFSDTSPVPVEAAREGRQRFLETVEEHPVPSCFSCGQLPDSMGVHAGPLDPSGEDDRYATDWTVPGWAVASDGTVDAGVLWAAIDCCAAWWVGWSRGRRVALTAQYAVEQLQPLEPGATYALVGWSGDHDPEWDGRKRHAASAAFDESGRCVARSTSFWISI